MIILTEFYQTVTGIYNQYSGDNSRPLASVAVHPNTDVISYSPLYESLNTFDIKNIKEIFGLNYLEYIELPTYVCEIMASIALERAKAKSNMTKDIVKELENK